MSNFLSVRFQISEIMWRLCRYAKGPFFIVLESCSFYRIVFWKRFLTQTHLWSHQPKAITWVYIIYCESVQPAEWARHVFWLLRQWLLDMLECMLTFAPSAKTPAATIRLQKNFTWAPWHYFVMYMRHKSISPKTLILPQSIYDEKLL